MLAKIGEVNYAIGLLDGRMRKIVHADLLKKAHERPKSLKFNEVVKCGRRKDMPAKRDMFAAALAESREEEDETAGA